jgi:hypothetical protein
LKTTGLKILIFVTAALQMRLDGGSMKMNDDMVFYEVLEYEKEFDDNKE